MKSLSTAILSLGLAAGIPAMAWADRADSSTYRFSYSASDLKSPERVAALHAEIEKAAREHCPDYFTIRNISDTRSCVRDVTEDLVKQIDNPRLTAYAAGQTTVELAEATPRG